MSVEIIHSEEAPAAIGPYSQAIALGNLVFTSGQIPLLANGEFLEAEVASQTHQVCKNLDAVLKAAGSGLSSVIKTTAVSYTHLTLPTNNPWCRSRWSPYH